jgi:hypothetical protein
VEVSAHILSSSDLLVPEVMEESRRESKTENVKLVLVL